MSLFNLEEDDPPLEDIPATAGPERYVGPETYHTPDGKPLVGMYVTRPDAKACEDQQIPSEYLAVHAKDIHPEDLLKLGKAGYHLVSEEELEGQGAVATVKVLPFRHEDGLGILKRYGQKRYQLWLDTKEREAAIAAELKVRNGAMVAQQARPKRPVAKPVNANPIVTIQEPGQLPQTFVLTPKTSIWQRIRTFFTRLFRRNP